MRAPLVYKSVDLWPLLKCLYVYVCVIYRVLYRSFNVTHSWFICQSFTPKVGFHNQPVCAQKQIELLPWQMLAKYLTIIYWTKSWQDSNRKWYFLNNNATPCSSQHMVGQIPSPKIVQMVYWLTVWIQNRDIKYVYVCMYVYLASKSLSAPKYLLNTLNSLASYS